MKHHHLLLLFVIFNLSIININAQNFISSEVIIENSVCKIYGTLLAPENLDNKIPVVILIAGSGPTDRDGNNTQISPNSLKFLAQELAKNNIASLRYDKRAIAKSKIENFKEDSLRFENYVEDAILWIDFLKADKRFSKIIVAGHSEGSLIGMIACNGSNADKFISLAGAGMPADTIIKIQLEQNAPSMSEQANIAIDSLKAGFFVKKYPVALASIFRKSVQPYLISWFKYNPAVEIAKLKIPTLIIQGNSDIQVSVENAELLKAANSNAEYHIIDRMNHIFKDSGPGMNENLATYYNSNLPVKPELVKIIVDFISK
jgi:pimeloyl-ACP methyl ester carboxylesterase